MKGVREVVFVVLVAAGCVSDTSGAQLTRRASFDLGCAKSNLRYRRIDDRTQGVLGCGKRAIYVESCEGPQISGRCSWVLNGGVTSMDPPQ